MDMTSVITEVEEEFRHLDADNDDTQIGVARVGKTELQTTGSEVDEMADTVVETAHAVKAEEPDKPVEKAVEKAVESVAEPDELTKLKTSFEALKNRNMELETVYSMYETYKRDPKVFIEQNHPEFQFRSNEKSLQDKVKEIQLKYKQKFGNDFLADGDVNDPDSPAFAYSAEVDTVKTEHIRESVQREEAVRGSVAKRQQVLQESIVSAVKIAEDIKKDYGLDDEKLKPLIEEFDKIKDNQILLFGEFLKKSAQAKYGLNAKASRLAAQEEILKKKTSPSTPSVGSKVDVKPTIKDAHDIRSLFA